MWNMSRNCYNTTINFVRVTLTYPLENVGEEATYPKMIIYSIHADTLYTYKELNCISNMEDTEMINGQV